MEIHMEVADDIDLFLEMRIKLFKELGEINEDSDIQPLIKAMRSYYLEHIGKDLICWFAIVDGKTVATSSLNLALRIPYHNNLQGAEGYILNVYTLPEFRGKGIARQLILEIMNYARKTGVKRLWLDSSKMGRSVYRSCGFIEKTSEMELFL